MRTPLFPSNKLQSHTITKDKTYIQKYVSYHTCQCQGLTEIDPEVGLAAATDPRKALTGSALVPMITGQKETDLGTGLVTDLVIGLGTCLVIGQGTGLVIGLMVDHVADLVKGHVTESGIAAAVAGEADPL